MLNGAFRGFCFVLLGFPSTATVAASSWVDPITGVEFSRIEKGCYKMGLPAKAFADDNPDLHSRAKAEMPQHEVCVDAFWLARHELRETAWQKLMGPRAATNGNGLPAVNMSWVEAQEFLRRLNARTAANGPSESRRFRLPTEAEWEYACRAGAAALTQVPDWGMHDPFAWYASAYGGYSGLRPDGIQPVGGKRANAWGLHDMLGNVWEWVQDSYLADGYTRHTLYNPVVDAGAKRVIRGGSVRTSRLMTRCETRAWQTADEKLDTVGLRLVRED